MSISQTSIYTSAEFTGLCQFYKRVSFKLKVPMNCTRVEMSKNCKYNCYISTCRSSSISAYRVLLFEFSSSCTRKRA